MLKGRMESGKPKRKPRVPSPQELESARERFLRAYEQETIEIRKLKGNLKRLYAIGIVRSDAERLVFLTNINQIGTRIVEIYKGTLKSTREYKRIYGRWLDPAKKKTIAEIIAHCIQTIKTGNNSIEFNNGQIAKIKKNTHTN